MNDISSVAHLFVRRNWTLVLATIVALGSMGMSTPILAQSTAGSVFGRAPVGDTITIHSAENGIHRSVLVAKDGRYVLRALPSGIYDVVLKEGGLAVRIHPKVPVLAGRGSKVDFECDQGRCEKGS